MYFCPVQTPERIEFQNPLSGNISSEHDDPLSQIDEDEWTDRNFGASTAEIGSSDEEDSSSLRLDSIQTFKVLFFYFLCFF